MDLSRSTKKPIEVNLLVDYSSDPDRRLELSGQIENASDENRLNYTYSFVASHPFSNLMLDCKGGVFTRSKWYKTSHSVDYKRTYLPLQSGESLALVDVRNSEVEFKRKTVTELSYFRGKYQGGYPLYTANVSAIYGADTNASGTFRLDLEKKLIASELNFTEGKSWEKTALRIRFERESFQMRARACTSTGTFPTREALSSTYGEITRTFAYRTCPTTSS